MKKFLLLLFGVLSLVSLSLLPSVEAKAWTGSLPSTNLPAGIDPIASYNSLDFPDITESDSFIVYKQATNPDRVYMFVAYGTNQIRVGSANGQSFISSASGTWNRFFINPNGTNGLSQQDWSNAEFEAIVVYQAYRIYYDNYTGVEFPVYQFPQVPVIPDPEPQPLPDSEKYYVRFGQVVGFIIILLAGVYTIWLLRFRR